jgi:hypothetical protein
LATLAACKILDAAPCGFERVMNHQLEIGVRRLGLCVTRSRRFSIHWNPVDRNGHAFDDNFLPGQSQVDANVEGLAFFVVAVRDLNGHATPYDAVVERFEFFSLCTNPILNFGGMFHIAKRDLQWKRHGPLPCVNCFYKLELHFPDPYHWIILAENPYSDVTGVTFGSDDTHCATIG